jgi:hypothetical protein
MVALSAEYRQLLLESRRHALEVLSASEQRARMLLDDAERAAVALLLKQRKIAAELLASQIDDDEKLIETNRLAAEALVKAEKLKAGMHREAVEYEVIDILCRGQREAAAILLEAQMNVTDARKYRIVSTKDPRQK